LFCKAKFAFCLKLWGGGVWEGVSWDGTGVGHASRKGRKGETTEYAKYAEIFNR